MRDETIWKIRQFSPEIIALLVCLLFLVVIAAGTAQANENHSMAHIVINEIEANPPGNDNSKSVIEWVELYNPTPEDIDLTGWTLETTHGRIGSVACSGIIEAKGYRVFGSGSQWLDNKDDSVILRDKEGMKIDDVAFRDTYNDARTKQKYPNGKEPWRFRWQTEGYSNGGHPPVAVLKYKPYCPIVNQTITFNASSSYDPDDPSGYYYNITSYDWDFGDGNTTTGKIVNHSYSSAGNYTINLTVTDNEGLTNSTTKVIYVGISLSPWIGTTSQGKIVSFNVSEAKVCDFNTSWNFTSGNFTNRVVAYGSFRIGPIDIVGNEFEFEWQFKDDYNDSALIYGEFISPNFASGFFRKTGTGYDTGNITWNATKVNKSSLDSQTLKIAAFNIQIFGKTKREKKDVMDVLIKIGQEFDVMLVQELKYADENTAPYYLEKINEAVGYSKYDFKRSERLGRSSSKEAYAYFYNTDKVEFIEGSDYVYNDTDDVFEREPYIASFRGGNFDFTLVGVHTKPNDADSEISNLPDVVDSILADNPNETDIIVMGDFNADGRYFNEDDSTNPFKASKYLWVITNDMDTMTKTNNTYDRMVMMNATLNHEYINGSATVFYFDTEYEISDEELVWDVSDHYPIYANFRTDLTDDD